MYLGHLCPIEEFRLYVVCGLFIYLCVVVVCINALSNSRLYVVVWIFVCYFVCIYMCVVMVLRCIIHQPLVPLIT